MAIFAPHVMSQRHGYANFGAFAASLMKHSKPGAPNPNTKPRGQESRKVQLQKLLGLDWYYGGWMEDRSIVWSDTYLKETGNFLHLGIDCSVNAKTLVFAVSDGDILYSGTDMPEIGGWGGHVVQKIRYQGEETALIYGHLGGSYVPSGSFVRKGEPIGRIGTKEENGFWGEHLHLQLVREVDHVKDWRHFFDKEMDGYGKVKDIKYWARRCPDPTPLLFI